MGILDGLNVPQKLPNCKVRTTLNELDPDDRKLLQQALDNPAWKSNPLSDALLARGIALDGKLIGRHRSKLCSCQALGNQ